MSKHVHAYTDEQEAYLRKASLSRVSYKQMAVDFNSRFGTRLSRNSILGKCNRMGLRGTKPPATYRQRKGATPTRKTPFVATRARALAETARPPASASEDLLRRDAGTNRVEAGTRQENKTRTPFAGIDSFQDGTAKGKPFLELRRTECKWPVTNDCSWACGNPITIGSYCTKHARIAYRAMPTVSRNRKTTAGAGYLDTRGRDHEADAVVTHMLENGGVQAPSLIPSFLPATKETT
jgi:hypothetical protein